MVALVLQQFGGMLPRFGEELIPATAATIAKNCRLLSGELQALKQPVLIASFDGWSEVVTRVFRVQTADGGFYAAFGDESIDFVKAPVVTDSFNRHYWSSEDDFPRYATEDMLFAAFMAKEPPIGWRLGIPAPASELAVAVKDPDTPETGAVFYAEMRGNVSFKPTISWYGTEVALPAHFEMFLPLVATFGGDGSTLDLNTPEEVVVDPLDETRVYVYTFLSAYGEEGAPSPPVIVTGSSLDEWHITGFETVEPPPADERNITQIKLYRTITGTFGNVSYYLVDTLPLGTASYVDTKTAEEISLNPILQSQLWNEPPEGLTGIIVHPNGFLLGFVGRDLYMSVPFRPHAWPVAYILSMRWNIVGLGIVGQSVVVLTEGAPQVAAGVRPEMLSLVKSDTPDPCLSRRGIVSTHSGVCYPGIDGLMIVSPMGEVVNLTKSLVSRREWATQYHPYAIHAAKHDSQYIAFYASGVGFAIDFEEKNQAFIVLEDPLWEHTSLQEDPVSGQVWLVQDQQLRVWNPETGAPVPYVWLSKEFVVPDPTNFGAFKVTYKDITGTGIYDPIVRERMQAYNDLRIQQPLNPLNFSALGSVHVVDLAPVLWDIDEVYQTPQHKQPYHESPLFLMEVPSTAPDLFFRIYVNREPHPYYQQEITDMEAYRPDTGFKAILWKFELAGTADVQNVKIATTMTELSTI